MLPQMLCPVLCSSLASSTRRQSPYTRTVPILLHRQQVEVDDVKYHLYRKGFVPKYDRWTCHGEKHDGSGSSQHFEPSTFEHTIDLRIGDYTQMVMDAGGPVFESRVVHDEEPNPEDKKLYDLLQAADEELWPGCRKATLLSAVSRMLNIKADFNLPERWYDVQCQLMHDVMPEGNHFVKNFYETKKLIEGLGLPCEKIDCCQFGCMLYWKQDAELNHCKICGKPRYKETNGKAVAIRYMFYLPITPRLKRLYVSSQTASHMRWHADHRHANTDDICHPCDSTTWKELDAKYPSFGCEPRNIRLGLCTDGFQPFGQSGRQYSCWPVVVTPYNLPPNMCLKEEYLFLSLVVPGGANPKQKIDIYLQPLIEELTNLWNNGVETYDSSLRQNFRMKAALLWTIGDLPAYSMMSGWGTSGKTACPICQDQTTAFTLPEGRKQSWFDTHRKFLPSDHPYRSDRKRFKKEEVERMPPPHIKSGVEQIREIDQYGFLKVTEPDAEERNTELSHVCGWRKRSIFWDLPYWSSLLIRHNIDVMHVEKNVFENVFNTIMDVKGKTKDNARARADMTRFCDKKELEFDTRRQCYPSAAYTLDKVCKKEFLPWVEQLKLPDGYMSNVGRCVNMAKYQMFGMKSHDCHVFMQLLLPIGLRDLLPKKIWEPITELSNFFRRLTSKVISSSDMERLEAEIPVILCKLETIFVPGFFNSMEHLPVHLPFEAKIAGPVQFRWMYPFERFLRRLKKMIANKAQVEGSIVNAFLVREASFFCSHYFEQHVFTRGRNVPRQDDGGVRSGPNVGINVFSQPYRLGGKPKRRYLLPVEKQAMQTYFLLNVPECDAFISLFEEVLRREHPSISDFEVASQLQNVSPPGSPNMCVFTKVMEQDNIPKVYKDIAHGPLVEVTRHNKCFINGYRFHTEKYGTKKVSYNSGVCVDCDGLEYYGHINEILEVEFPALPIKRCVFFNCDWYDPTPGVGTKKHEKYNMVEVNKKKRLQTYEPFILAMQATQVFYLPFSSMRRDRVDWLAVFRIKPRGWIDVGGEIAENSSKLAIYQDVMVDTCSIEQPTEGEQLYLASTDDGNGIPIDDSDESDAIEEEIFFLRSSDSEQNQHPSSSSDDDVSDE
ncbi:uncharacterized protein LOC127257857 [Andrographis paniculata]|uniref:uncharacterized protein LOC127257857 n=1 Tax=Andrographis paniculata TaxID=175694 RepID=UPI0021E83A21|nr:uncharacterized protein LOC127257857 [Andrographis paniculata]